MSKFFETEEFKQLQQFWYKKLERVGFKDAEEVVGDELKLRQNASNVYRQASQLTREAKLAYFEALSSFIQSSPPEDPVHKMVMEQRASGALLKEIVRSLKAQGIVRGRETVRFIIRRYETQWGVRKWTKEKLKKRHQKKT